MRPYPPQKVSSDIDRIRAQTWNQLIECLVYAMSHPRGDGVTVLNTAADLLSAAARGGAAPGGGGPAEYSGYFKLTLANTEGGYAVTIADGATGGDSTAVVNGGRVWSVAPYTEAVAGDRLFFLKFTPPEYDQYGAVTVPESLVIASLGPSGGVFPVLPDGGTDGAYYMQLGRLLWNSGAPRVVQDHTAGVAEFNWFVRCDRFTS